jgi:GABA(A) receptor-associated protein
MTFKSEYTFERRQKEASEIRQKHASRVPVICEKNERSNVPLIDKKKFLVPNDLTTGQFLYVIRKRMKMSPSEALFLITENGALPPTSSTLSEIYAKNKSDDGFLYLKYTGENTFGWCLAGLT